MQTMEDGYRIRIDDDLDGLELVEAVHDRPYFARHVHPTYALGIVQRGANRFRYRGAFHTAAAGAVCTVTPDEAHEVEPAAGAGFAYRCLYPSLETMREVAESVAGRRVGTLALPPVIEDVEAARAILALFEAEASGAPRIAREARLVALLARVTVRHATQRVAPRGKTPPPAALARAREYLAEHCAENVGLAELAATVGVDRFGLVRGFSRAYGLPPHAWLLQERVRRAQRLLRAGRRAADVAAEVGFADQSHLTRRFKQVVGVTPGRYRAAATRLELRPRRGVDSA
jgi:AraC-like DNA-binding protein